MTIFDACMGQRKKVVLVFFITTLQKFLDKISSLSVRSAEIQTKQPFVLAQPCTIIDLTKRSGVFGEKNANQLHSVSSLEYFAAVDFMLCTKKDF